MAEEKRQQEAFWLQESHRKQMVEDAQRQAEDGARSENQKKTDKPSSGSNWVWTAGMGTAVLLGGIILLALLAVGTMISLPFLTPALTQSPRSYISITKKPAITQLSRAISLFTPQPFSTYTPNPVHIQTNTLYSNQISTYTPQPIPTKTLYQIKGTISPLTINLIETLDPSAGMRIPLFTVIHVFPDQKLVFHTSDFPAGVQFIVRMGIFGTQAIDGIIVANFDSGKGGILEGTLNIPEDLKGNPMIAVRMDSMDGYYL